MNSTVTIWSPAMEVRQNWAICGHKQLLLEIETDDFYRSIEEHLGRRFDTSRYSWN